MKVLITGGAGYLGSVLCSYLVGSPYEVTVVDNFIYNQTPLLEHCWLGGKWFNVIRKDYRNLDKEFIQSFDFIIHLACLTGAPLSEFNYDSWDVNCHGVKALLKKCKEGQPFIFPCTNSGYGIGQTSILCNEDTPLNPLSAYGKQKVAAEQEVLKHGGISLRLATLFGASTKMRLDLLVNDLVYRAVTDKVVVLFESHFKRNYVHVRDACHAIRFSLDNFKLMLANAYNIGLSDANLSKFELAKKIKIHIPELAIIESEINKDPDQRNYIVSNEKIERIGFKAMISLDDGIQELIRAYQIIKRNQYSNI